MAWALNDMGIVAWRQNDAEQMVQFHERSLVLKRELGDERDVAASIANLAEGLRWQGETDRAGDLLEECLTIARRIGDKYMIAVICNNLAYVRHNQGDFQTAKDLFTESLALNVELKDRVHIAGCLAGLAGVAAHRNIDGARRAAHLFGAIEPLLSTIGAVLDASDRKDYDRNLATAQAKLGEAEWKEAWQEGLSMSMEQAIEYALSTTIKVLIGSANNGAHSIRSLIVTAEEGVSGLNEGLHRVEQLTMCHFTAEMPPQHFNWI